MPPDWKSLHFGEPWVLAFLPAAFLVLWWLGRTGRTPALTISSLTLVRGFAKPVRARTGRARDWLRWLAVMLVVMALARPQLDRPPRPEEARAIDIMLLVDASRSMETRDFLMDNEQVSRLDALRRVVAEFVRERPKDRIGVIGFAEKPFLLCPLTIDHSWMLESLENIETSLGTAMGSSVEAGVDLLRAGGNSSRVMILITDGLNTSGSDPLKAAQFAARAGVRLHTIAAVSYENTVTANFDSHPLYVMANTTGGRFFQAGNTDSLTTIYGEIDQLERQHLQQLRSRHVTPIFGFFAALSGFVLGAEVLLGATRWLRIP